MWLHEPEKAWGSGRGQPEGSYYGNEAHHSAPTCIPLAQTVITKAAAVRFMIGIALRVRRVNYKVTEGIECKQGNVCHALITILTKTVQIRPSLTVWRLLPNLQMNSSLQHAHMSCHHSLSCEDPFWAADLCMKPCMKLQLQDGVISADEWESWTSEHSRHTLWKQGHTDLRCCTQATMHRQAMHLGTSAWHCLPCFV